VSPLNIEFAASYRYVILFEPTNQALSAEFEYVTGNIDIGLSRMQEH